jgi:hypothetical protein
MRRLDLCCRPLHQAGRFRIVLRSKMNSVHGLLWPWKVIHLGLRLYVHADLGRCLGRFAWRKMDLTVAASGFRIIYGKQQCEKRNNKPLILEVSACIVFGTKVWNECDTIWRL